MSSDQNSSIQLTSLNGTDKDHSFSTSSDDFDGIRIKRLVAYAIDVVCIACLGFIATIIATLMGIVTFGLLSPILAVGLALVPIAYHTITIGSEWNATIGMRVMGIEVYLYSGEKPDYLTAFIHSGLFYASLALTSSLILLVSLFNDKGRLLHDYLTNSGVRRVRSS
ncbi:RDD family protein [Sneathiella glossodoripedis]|uniref:RDD family protein n=1 Tax=Sneathiella glossodoripedis TaxID=418853 RepID=UPI00046E8E7D|nr:RDD family protein [Sneathiella glossodoripedis]